MNYDNIVLSILVQCLVPAKSSAHLPASYFGVPFFITTLETHCGTYAASHIVGHDISESHQANGVLIPMEDPFLNTKHLGKIKNSFQTILIAYHTLQCCCIIPYLGDHSLLLLY